MGNFENQNHEDAGVALIYIIDYFVFGFWTDPE
jgi:hypothetical protein